MPPPPRDPDPPAPRPPPDSLAASGSWFRVSHSSEEFAPFTQAPQLQGKTAWPRLPGFEILGELDGGDSVFYKARQEKPERTVALKWVGDAASFRPNGPDGLRAEKLDITLLQHPNISQIYEVGDLNGRPFLVMEYPDAGPLHRWLLRTPPSPHQAAMLLEPLARAIQYAHERGVIHRNLKPSNILLTRVGRPEGDADSAMQAVGRPPRHANTILPKISDFGLAKDVHSADSLSRSGFTGGTLQYMSPEQFLLRPEQVGPATDIYSL